MEGKERLITLIGKKLAKKGKNFQILWSKQRMSKM